MKSETLNYHEVSYGWNFEVTINYEAGITYVKRYFTNGADNRSYETKTFFEARKISKEEAEAIMADQRYFLSEKEINTKPLNKRGAVVRKRELNRFFNFLNKVTSFSDYVETDRAKALENCNI